MMIVLYPCTNDLCTVSTTAVGFFMPIDRGAQQFFIILESVHCLAMACALFCLFFILTLAFDHGRRERQPSGCGWNSMGKSRGHFP